MADNTVSSVITERTFGGGESAVNRGGGVSSALTQAELSRDANEFSALVKEMQNRTALNLSGSLSLSGLSSSEVRRGSRLNGDYTQGFSGAFTSESDKHARPSGLASQTRTKDGGTPVIDKTSELYEQSLELENYFVKILLSSARATVQKSSLAGSENEYARNMYEDMMWDNISEAVTKNASFGLADQIYIELSGQL